MIRRINNRQAGFTLLELIVATGLLATMMTGVVAYVVHLQNSFFEDVVRTRINSNLRSASDIISMNIRQSGEYLYTSFPAILISQGDTVTSDSITLRRAIISEILTVCVATTVGATTVAVSSSAIINSECVGTNVVNLYNAFNAERIAQGGSIRAYIYDRVAKVGEFVNFTNGTTALGDYSLTVSPVSRVYPILASNVYIIEEYRFNVDLASSVLRLYRDGMDAQPESVAFGVTGFDISARVGDGSTIETLTSNGAYTWKDTRSIKVILTGSENRKTRTFSTSITGEYFPRNILSR